MSAPIRDHRHWRAASYAEAAVTTEKTTMTTPIIAGFYPDPSICQVGDVNYIANSSFEYVSGVPIHRSTDLVTRTLVGNALRRPSQLDLTSAPASIGVFAPTLRHHGDRFWLVTTNALEIQRGQLIVTAEDPAGPWSDPVHVDGAVGIDPESSFLLRLEDSERPRWRNACGY
ncbi:family 43 glycosylhydrolase [Streptomyces sp. NPDC013978]|uniref:family 43 glycosylhydrolase n=1 Tax=Streptomyces sp. NPDC013978 TaxID=3364869 RepID=UPI0036F96DBC